ncbi:MAG: hypothetical protein ACJ8FY_23210 [Gemmataceae bacterium]
MRAKGRRRLLDGLLLVMVLSAAPGCLSYLHPVEPLEKPAQASCVDIPRCCRDHVYVFCINGLDPFDYSNQDGLRDYIHELGFNKLYNGEMYHTTYFQKELHRLHEEDPEARFVLIGFSFGANCARAVARDAKDKGIPIDLLVYLGANTFKNEERNQPENTLRILNILAEGLIWNGDVLDRAENIQVKGVWHFGSPTHPKTLELLESELAQVASRVTVVEISEKPRPQDAEPTPRVMPPAVQGPRDDWDFLKPVSSLSRNRSISTSAKPKEPSPLTAFAAGQ